ncbi:MAG TPA: transcriptional regulator [Deltaproteobacteria bacterium]|nr:transcriptional regulator [Deltaproteobacteria bacterium]
MVDKDIVLEKVGQIQNCLKRIHEKTNQTPQSLDSLDVQDIFVLNLQRAVQSAIDLAAHVVSDEGLGLPADLKENFDLLERANIIEDPLATKMKKMVGFRNIAVREYSEIDVDVLKKILMNHLKDIEEFYISVLKHFQLV